MLIKSYVHIVVYIIHVVIYIVHDVVYIVHDVNITLYIDAFIFISACVKLFIPMMVTFLPDASVRAMAECRGPTVVSLPPGVAFSRRNGRMRPKKAKKCKPPERALK